MMTENPFTIEETVFVYCPASYEGKVVVPEGITDIGDRTCMFCQKVNAVELPDSLEGIGLCAFHGCNFERIKIPERCHYIADAAFLCCQNLKEIDFPDGLLVIGDAIFYCCI